VSETTNSISAILQLVLAMDYSIIVSNRYRQSCKKIDNKSEAMAEAIKGAIPSVCSSSLTTIVGLLALCFMKFKIGADLGIVLAKGVFISLVCVFTVLPALLLLFNKAIEATRKKMIPVPVEWLGKLSFKGRYVIKGAFVVLFVGVFIAKGNIGISYSMPTEDEIADVFPTDNSFVMLYHNEDEDNMIKITDTVADMTGVKSVNSYGTTLSKEMNADEMYHYIADMMSENTSSFQLNKEMISLLYYDSYSDRENEEMTLEEFVSFVNANILTNDSLSGQIDDSIKTQLCYQFQVSSKEYQDLAETIERMKNTKIKYHYNGLGAAFSILHIWLPIKIKEDYFCSEFVATQLVKMTSFDLKRTPNMYLPTNLAKSLARQKNLYRTLVNEL
jgi:predicted RND superfamily exporter protein